MKCQAIPALTGPSHAHTNRIEEQSLFSMLPGIIFVDQGYQSLHLGGHNTPLNQQKFWMKSEGDTATLVLGFTSSFFWQFWPLLRKFQRVVLACKIQISPLKLLFMMSYTSPKSLIAIGCILCEL